MKLYDTYFVCDIYIETAWARFLASSFNKADLIYCLIVPSLKSSVCAISLVDKPLERAFNISFSLGLSLGCE